MASGPRWQLGLATRAFAYRGGIWSHAPDHPLTPAAYLGWVRRLKLSGLYISTLRHFAAPLEVALPPLAAQARQQGLYLQLATGPGTPLPLTAVLDRAAAAGVRLVVRQAEGYQEGGSGRGERVDSVAEVTRAVVARAAELGCSLALAHGPGLPAARLAALLEDWASPHLGAVFDPLAALLAGEEPVAAARLLAPHAVTALVRDVVVIPVDGGAEGGGRVWLQHVLPGEGQLDVWGVMEQLAAAQRLRTVNLGSPLERVQADAGTAPGLFRLLAAGAPRRPGPAAAPHRHRPAVTRLDSRSLLQAEERAVRAAAARLLGRYGPGPAAGEPEHTAGRLPIIGQTPPPGDDRAGEPDR